MMAAGKKHAPAGTVAAGSKPWPYRMALAGGWIDQPFVSRCNPSPPGSMVVVSLEPSVRFMERAGMATGTRKVAEALWPAGLPPGDPAARLRELFEAENRGRADPSGSQDMAGLLYPGVCRLDYDAAVQGGVYPCRIACCVDPSVAAWVERMIHVLPVAARPPGYHPLGEQSLEPAWIARLGASGRACYDAILRGDLGGLGASMNECMACWEAILPRTVRHPAITTDLVGLLQSYQSRYPGAMYSGCGGGYLYVASEEKVPGTFTVKVRLPRSEGQDGPGRGGGG